MAVSSLLDFEWNSFIFYHFHKRQTDVCWFGGIALKSLGELDTHPLYRLCHKYYNRRLIVVHRDIGLAHPERWKTDINLRRGPYEEPLTFSWIYR